MNTFYLEILSPDRIFYRGECKSIVIPISDGMLGIMANHSPLTAAIPQGELTFTKPSGEKVVCAIDNGMADVTDNRVRVLCESVVTPDEIDMEKERKEAEHAERALKNRQSQNDYKYWKMSLNKAVNRLKIKQKEKNINI